MSLVGRGQDTRYEGFLHASGKRIVDGQNREVILRGMGLGGWMLQEGYMLETASFAGTQHEIRAHIESLVGPEATDSFYNAWLANHVTRADIDSLAKWGFNSVRPALHYNLFTLPIEAEPVLGRQTWIEKGFVMLDSLIAWCAANRMYVILDLHAAPGGQGRDNNISDRDPAKLSLWESSANRTKTVELWKRLAERYAGNPWVGGYDILNETNWDFENSGNPNGCNCTTNAPLLDLFRNIITAIRSKDNRHLIFIEGNCWSGNFNGLTPLAGFDDNLALSFHRYWCGNDKGTIQDKLDLRDKLNVPLWMGESGENSNHWFAEAIALLENQDIGWSWWPEKKINSVVGPMTVIKTPEYQQLLRYWENGGAKPSDSFALAALMKIADNLKIANCRIHYDVIDALTRQPYTTGTKPFAPNRIPGTIHAVNFDMGRNGYAYNDTDYQNTGGAGSSTWNKGNLYRNDGPDIEACYDSTAYSNGFNINNIEKGEWLAFTIYADTAGVYDLTVRTAAAGGTGAFRILIDGVDVTGTLAVPHTGGPQRFIPIRLKDIELAAGQHRMVIHFVEGGFGLNSFAFNGPTGATQVPFRLLSARTDELGRQVILTFNKNLDGYPSTGTDFILSTSTGPVVPDSVTLSSGRPQDLTLWISDYYTRTDLLKISYGGTSLSGPGGEILPPFYEVPVVNLVLPRLPIPGRIQAENCIVNEGFAFEACSDGGGGQDAGWSDPGDYLEFPVEIEEKALYRMTFRYACYGTPSRARLSLTDGAPVLLAPVEMGVTGGWQNWASETVSDTLPAGMRTLRFTALTNGFNLNWIDFEKVPNPPDSTVIAKAGFRIYPNPASGFVFVEINNPGRRNGRLELIDVAGRILLEQDTPPVQTVRYTLDTSAFLPGIYFIRLGGEQDLGTKTLMIKNLKL
jgi:endoglucanase